MAFNLPGVADPAWPSYGHAILKEPPAQMKVFHTTPKYCHGFSNNYVLVRLDSIQSLNNAICDFYGLRTSNPRLSSRAQGILQAY